jgi:hypothetical protein
MGTPVNPILVIRDNLPDYRSEVAIEIDELAIRLAAKQEELETLDALVATLKAQDARILARTP